MTVHIEPEPSTDSEGRIVWRLAPLIGLGLLFTIWEAYVRIADVRPLILPPPTRVIRHIVDDPGFYWSNGLVTVTEAAVGFVLALVVALLVATAMAHSRLVERATLPVIVLIQATPVAALAPVFLVWFGFSATPKVLIAALFAFVPFVSNALTGLRSIDTDTLEVMRSVDASTWEVFWRLRLPHALPAIFAAARICVGLALVGAVIGELYGGSASGLGYAARIGQTRSLVDQLWGSIFTLAFIGIVTTSSVAAAERRMLGWHSSQQL